MFKFKIIKIILIIILLLILINKRRETFYNYETKTKWSQVGRKVYLHINEDKFYFLAPKNFLIKNVSEEKKNLAIDILLKRPSLYQSNSLKPYKTNKNKNIGLCLSMGKDSVSSYLSLPEKQVTSFYLKRDTESEESLKLLNKYKFKKVDKNYNYNALKNINSSKIKNIHIIPNNFELIRLLYEKNIGFMHGSGYISIVILLSDFYNIDKIALGPSLETTGYMNNIYKEDLDKLLTNFLKLNSMLKKYNLRIIYPVGGCSEIVTTNMVERSTFNNTVSSCQNKTSENKCKKCVKCYRYYGIVNANIEQFEKLKQHNRMPKKPSFKALGIYINKKNSSLKNKALNKYSHLNFDMLEKYYTPYYSEPFLPNELLPHIKNKFKKYGIKPMNNNDISLLKKNIPKL